MATLIDTLDRMGRALVIGLLLLALPSGALANDDDNVLVLGRNRDNPQAHYEQPTPLLVYVVPRMPEVDRKSVVEGKRGSVRFTTAGTSAIKKKQPPNVYHK